ncbi:type II toxin-antitoxin system prevent-host-death family antitoxin [Catenulispora sp. NF23]|uniref:Type II toxin-antitoxin system prevent-host-death family antitoxin n=1 Tax=Catenulispora pinistramenti TaxID=2705254 RepID=A0ABS5KST8_9ACTN|nr:type II toxin-antitoxin system prevent-host-death family antitoxin [Catenulispora pinistramenti]MBS2532437.1 type II toxin-antitoxin system prevent-host-death family antitoxin [Catenulispora pinistramenti]MBS2549096.1 type II toxin-antitoxin system prevent-host-death family antitoxin [Catenulispora pinistramenti]
MEAAYTLDDARALFPDLVEEARLTRHPVYVTDEAGEPVVAIVGMRWLEECEKLLAQSGSPA